MTNVSMESVLERMTVFSDAATYAFRCDVLLRFGIVASARDCSGLSQWSCGLVDTIDRSDVFIGPGAHAPTLDADRRGRAAVGRLGVSTHDGMTESGRQE